MSFTAPDACTLPTAELDVLFATAVRRVDTLGPTHARLRLGGRTGLVGRAA